MIWAPFFWFVFLGVEENEHRKCFLFEGRAWLIIGGNWKRIPLKRQR